MNPLSHLDYSIIFVYIIFSLLLGFYYTKKASRSVEDFFISSRSLPWYLIGFSMAATNLSIDTPLAITKYVFEEGISGVWFFWSNAINTLLACFVFSRLWRRAEVITDVQIIETRYSGRGAAFLRIFKGCYFGILYNGFVMGWVFAGLIKVMTGLTNFSVNSILIFFTALTFIYTVASGFYGVVLTDFFQYFLAMIGSILFAILAVRYVGGMDELLLKIGSLPGSSGDATAFIPNFSSGSHLALSLFFTYLLVQWWSHKYSDGGGKHIQRMLAARGPRDAVTGTFIFSILSYVFQVWPWIVTALVSIVVFGHGVADPEMTYPLLMRQVLPSGLLGFVVVGLLAAFMSTIDTHLTLGASYMVNDLYRRFLVKNASERHYVFMSRVAVGLSLAIAILIGLNIKSIGGMWKFVINFASGAGLVWIMRWFWWRINPWSELTSMVVSGIVSSYLYLVHPALPYSYKMWLTVSISAACWITVTLLTKPSDDERLVEFVRKVRPGYLGWRRIYQKYQIPKESYLRYALVQFLIGILFLFSLNFGIGHLILQRWWPGFGLLSLSLLSGGWLIHWLKKQEVGVRSSNVLESSPSLVSQQSP